MRPVEPNKAVQYLMNTVLTHMYLVIFCNHRLNSGTYGTVLGESYCSRISNSGTYGRDLFPMDSELVSVATINLYDQIFTIFSLQMSVLLIYAISSFV